jgi:exonuclease VII large subunit
MPTQAKVHSTESIEAVRMTLMSFVEMVGDSLTELSSEMRRVLDWLEHDRPRHWKTQVRIAVDQVHEAQQALNRCLMFPVANERPSCYEERAALKKAQARLAYCEQKAERVRHWQRTMQHELFEYEGRISQLLRLVEVDVPAAIGVLNRIVRHLEEYQSLRATNPSAAYSDMAIAQEIWPAGEKSTESDGEKVEDKTASGVVTTGADAAAPANKSAEHSDRVEGDGDA